MARTRSRNPRPARWQPRVAVVMLLVTSVPLVGVVAATYSYVRRTEDLERVSSVTQRHADRIAQLSRVDAALLDEKYWSAVRVVFRSFGLSDERAKQLIGIDIPGRMATRHSATDETLANAGGVDALVEELERVRGQDLDVAGTLAAYGQVQSMIAAPLSQEISGLVASAGGLEGEAIPRTVAALESALQLRSLETVEVETYFASLFAVRGAPVEEIRRLTELRSASRDALDRVMETASIDDDYEALALKVRDEPALRDFDRRVDALIMQSLTDGVPSSAAPTSLEAAVGHFGEFIAIDAATDASRDTHAKLIAHAAFHVLDEARELQMLASDQSRRAWWIATGVLVVGAGSTLLGAALIMRPLQRLRVAADALRDGTPRPIQPAGGPAEVRAANAALDEAAAHIELMTHQVEALSRGELEPVEQDAAASSPLSRAIHNSFSMLKATFAEREALRERLQFEASHDPLTGLPNRRATLQHLHECMEVNASGCVGVLFVDLDRFKAVNDTHGHQAGDAVLREVADRLCHCVGEGDLVGRLGGDEFLIVRTRVDNTHDLLRVAEGIRREMVRPIRVSSGSIELWASVGIAVGSAIDTTPDELVRDADLAVYQAKETPGGGIAVCDEAMRSEFHASAGIAQELAQGIVGASLETWYQPVVDANSGRIRGVEALVRWNRDGQRVSPDVFIPIAERSGLIIDIDRWVIRDVARQIDAWSREGRFLDVVVAINISARHFSDDRVVAHIADPFRDCGVAFDRVIVEVTETSVLDDVDRVIRKLSELRSLGFRVAIDDFGVGQTSLAHLHKLPIDILKIDRSIASPTTAQQTDASIAGLLIRMGHELGLTVVAEGVETSEDAGRLCELGADQLQGYFFARPMPASEIETVLARPAALEDRR